MYLYFTFLYAILGGRDTKMPSQSAGDTDIPINRYHTNKFTPIYYCNKISVVPEVCAKCYKIPEERPINAFGRIFFFLITEKVTCKPSFES